MTIEREDELELIIAVCDRCGARLPLDIDFDAPDDKLAAELVDCGWAHDKPDKHRFAGDNFGNGGHVQIYARDFCQDCQDDEPAPKPLIVGGRHHPPRFIVDAFANDPCDEWARERVWRALGLSPMCGHPGGGPECQYCNGGFPFGRTDQRWRR